VAGQRRHAPRPQARARAAAAAAPAHQGRLTEPRLSRFAPSGRSIVVGLGLLAAAAGTYVLARETAAFAIERVEVTGAPIAVRHEVRSAIAPFRGTSLLSLDGAALARRVEALPTVISVEYDRAFPHTLRLRVVAERPVAVVHRGRESWLVSARGRVLGRVPRGTAAHLPRIWVTRATPLRAGAFVDAAAAGTTARALALAARFPVRIGVAALAHGELVFRLRSGVQLRLGTPTDVRLKLAIARRALRALPPGTTYLDISVPGRPVAGTDSQLSGRD
jgi:cell division protein FtsQ